MNFTLVPFRQQNPKILISCSKSISKMSTFRYLFRNSTIILAKATKGKYYLKKEATDIKKEEYVA